MAGVIQGTLLLTVVALLAIRRWRTSRVERPAGETEPQPVDQLGVEVAPE
jgi:hypothetical protein